MRNWPSGIFCVLYSARFYNMEEKSSVQKTEIECFLMFLLIDNVLVSGKMMTKMTILIVKIFNYQIIAKLP